MDRTGVGTRAIFGNMLKFDLSRGFPILTTKKVPFKVVAAELAGFLEGTDNGLRMKELGASIWDANAVAWYESPKSQSQHIHDLGRIYGVQWRDWDHRIDQLREVVDRIITDPSDRRLIVTAWNPGELDLMCLPPCHTHFQFFVEGDKLDLIFYMRSVDTFLGMPFDISSYALLLHIVANETNLKPNILTGCFADTHIYNNHLEQCATLIGRDPYPLPELKLSEEATIDNFHPDMCSLINYQHHDAIKAEMAV